MSDLMDFLHAFAVVVVTVIGGLVLAVGTALAWALIVWAKKQWHLHIEDVNTRRLENADKAAKLGYMAPDFNGRYAMHVKDVSGHVAELLQLEAIRAEMQRTHPMPIHHYAPHYAPEFEYRGLPGGAQVVTADTDHQLPDFGPVPDFWQLFHSGSLPEREFLLGYSLEDHSEVRADWGNLYSALVGGQSGSGKSTLIRCMLAQAALKGSRFVVVDPHAKAGPQSLAASIQPLAGFMPFPPAGGSEQEMLDAVRYVSGVATARLRGEGPGQPLILVVDELTSILQGRHGATLKDEMINVLQQIATESRKVGVFAFGIGQNFHSRDFPSTVRDNFVSMLSCRARQRVARTMADDHEFGKVANALSTGQAVWLNTQGDQVAFSFPNTTQEHLTLVARQVASNGHWEVDSADYGSTSGNGGFQAASKRLPSGVHDAEDWPVEGPAGSQREATRKPTGSQPDAKTARVRDLLHQRKTPPQIIKEVWGLDSKGGNAYQKAQAELTDIIAHMIGGE